MEILKKIFGGIVLVTGVLSTIGGIIASRFWLVTIVILSILKIAGAIVMPWFAGLTTLSAIGTGLWLLGLGFVLIVVGVGVSTLSALIIGN